MSEVLLNFESVKPKEYDSDITEFSGISTSFSSLPFLSFSSVVSLMLIL